MSLSNGLEYRPRLRFPYYKNDDCWQAKTLKEMGSFYNGLSGKCKEDFNHGDARFVTYRNVFLNTFASVNQLEKIEIKPNEKQNKVSYGDVIFTQSSETFAELGLSSVWLHTFQPYLNSFCIGWHPNETASYSPEFMGYLLRTETVRKQIIIQGQGISRINLSANRIENIKLYFPNYSEQLKIADFLMLIDQKIQKQQQLVELLKKYKRGLNKLLLSKISKENNKLLGEVCTITGGGTPDTTNPEYWNGDISWFTPSEVGKTKYVYQSERKISASGMEKSSAKFLPKNTVLLTTRATLGEMSLLRIEATTNQGFQSLVANDNVLPEYLYYLQCIVKPWCQKYSSGNTFKEISKAALSKCIIPVPSLNEQLEIVNILSKIDDKIEKEYQIFSQLICLKKALLQQLFI